MSHFTVLVLGDNIAEKLAPYDENMSVEPYEKPCWCIGRLAKNKSYDQSLSEMVSKHPIINDILEKQINERNIKKAKAELNSDPKEKMRFDLFDHAPNMMDAFKEYAKGIKDDKNIDLFEKYLGRADMLFKKDPRREQADPECKECHGSGKEISTYNPNSKWDWYEEGGRWFGSFALKEKVLMDDNHVAQASWGWKGEEILEVLKDHRADKAKIEEIDWERTTKLSDEALKASNDLWDYIEEKITEEEAYEKHVFTFYKKEWYLKRYSTREEYIRRQGLFTTYAVVTEDGKWVGQGNMGWFGFSTETDEDSINWTNNFHSNFLKDLKPGTWLTVVDCHI